MQGFVIGVLMILVVVMIIGRFTKEHLEYDYDYLYQGGTLRRMKEGNYEGGEYVETILKQGTYGIGALERLKGELVIMGGVAYTAGSDCKAVKCRYDDLSPFYMVTHLFGGNEKQVGSIPSLSALIQRIADEHLDPDTVYCVKLTGHFDSVLLRGVDEVQKPYPKFADVVAKQKPVEFKEIRGTAFGVIMPASFDGINEAGLHLHFLGGLKKEAGHILDLAFERGTLQIEPRRGVSIKLDPEPFQPVNNEQKPEKFSFFKKNTPSLPGPKEKE